MNLDELELVAKWVELNKKLEAGWAPYRELAGQRDEIEKQVSFLKNKGVSPYLRKISTSSAPTSSSSTILIDPQSPPKRQKIEEKKAPGSSKKELEAKMKNLEGKGKTGSKSRSETGLNEDFTQNFPDNK